MDQAIDHDALDEILKSCGSNWDAGQVHGLLCSRLAVTGAQGASRWFAQILEDTDPDHDLRSKSEAALDGLYAETWRQLVERQSEFGLLLPDDDDPILVRTAAMVRWCEGFLHGLVSEKHSEDLKKRLSADPLADIIKDMLHITRASIGDDEDDDGNEGALTELIEYLRVAVQLIFEELADFRAPPESDTPIESEVLH